MQPPREAPLFKITQLKPGIYHAWLSLALTEPPSEEFLVWCGEREGIKEVLQHSPTNCTLIMEQSGSPAEQRSKIASIVRSLNQAFDFELHARELGYPERPRPRIARSGILMRARFSKVSTRKPIAQGLETTLKRAFLRQPRNMQ